MTAENRGPALKPKGKPRGKPFAKGNSANPGGRPKALVEVLTAARKHTVTAINALARIAKDAAQDPKARVAAAATILDRGWGKAPQSVELTGKDGAALFSGETEEQLRERLFQQLATDGYTVTRTTKGAGK